MEQACEWLASLKESHLLRYVSAHSQGQPEACHIPSSTAFATKGSASRLFMVMGLRCGIWGSTSPLVELVRFSLRKMLMVSSSCDVDPLVSGAGVSSGVNIIADEDLRGCRPLRVIFQLPKPMVDIWISARGGVVFKCLLICDVDLKRRFLDWGEQYLLVCWRTNYTTCYNIYSLLGTRKKRWPMPMSMSFRFSFFYFLEGCGHHASIYSRELWQHHIKQHKTSNHGLLPQTTSSWDSSANLWISAISCFWTLGRKDACYHQSSPSRQRTSAGSNVSICQAPNICAACWKLLVFPGYAEHRYVDYQECENCYRVSLILH